MAAGAQVCRYREDRASNPISFQRRRRPHSASGFLRNFAPIHTPQQHSLRVSSYPPCRSSLQNFELSSFTKQPSFSGETYGQRPLASQARPNPTSRYIFGCPLALQPNGLRSSRTFQAQQLNRLLFGGLPIHFSFLNLTYCISNFQKPKADTETNMCKVTVNNRVATPSKEGRKDVTVTVTVTPPTPIPVTPVREGMPCEEETTLNEDNPVQNSPSQLEDVEAEVVDDETAGNPNDIHTSTRPASDNAFLEGTATSEGPDSYEYPGSDNESEEEDEAEAESEEDEYGYETDSDEEEEEDERFEAEEDFMDDEDDLIEFSDECPSPGITPLNSLQCTGPSSSTLAPNDKSYLSLCSEESGYYDNGSEESNGSWSDDEGSDTEETTPNTSFCEDEEDNEDLWKSFQDHALSCSPHIVPKKVVDCKLSEKVPKTAQDSESLCETRKFTECPASPPLPRCPLTPPGSRSCKRRVSFKPDNELAVVHHMFTWSHAYRSCRRGPWEQYARDREHFKRRIASVACVLVPCLEKKLSSCPSVS